MLTIDTPNPISCILRTQLWRDFSVRLVSVKAPAKQFDLSEIYKLNIPEHELLYRKCVAVDELEPKNRK
jgi:hypothetical protein